MPERWGRSGSRRRCGWLGIEIDGNERDRDGFGGAGRKETQIALRGRKRTQGVRIRSIQIQRIALRGSNTGTAKNGEYSEGEPSHIRILQVLAGVGRAPEIGHPFTVNNPQRVCPCYFLRVAGKTARCV